MTDSSAVGRKEQDEKFAQIVKFRLSEKNTEVEKKSSSWF